MLYWTSNNRPHVLFGVINFISFFVLVLCEFILDCKILKNEAQDKMVNNEVLNTNDISISNNNMLKNFLTNKNNSKVKKDEKNGSNVPFFEKLQGNDNYFDNIKKVNLKSQNDIK